MKFKSVLNSSLCMLTALIWGSAFVAQSMAMDKIDPFTFNATRSYIGALILLPLIFFLRKRRPAEEKAKENKKLLVLGGVCCGVILSVASILQQYGIKVSTVGKSGFITAMYIVIVPVISVIFLKKRYSFGLWISVGAAILGLYLLTMNGETSFGRGDLLLSLCAIAFSGHILIIGYFSPKVDCVAMASIQFFVCAVLCTICAFIFETPSFPDILEARLPILYAGVLSSGVAYTLQMVGQKRTPPVIASMMFSLESVFAVLSGWIVLGEKLSASELVGCILMFEAIILSQLSQNEEEVI